LKLLDDVSVLKPTCFISVPRLFNRIYDRVLAGVKAKGGIAAFLFNTAYSQKKSALRKGTQTHFLWDALVFANVRAKLGGRVRFLFTGSAPISSDVMDFLKICFSCDVYEGYGQTETSAGISITYSGDCTSGHIGAPVACGEIKLVDVPSMNYTSKDKPNPRGEICVRGNQVFKGYYKEPEKTQEAFYEGGWLRTGDVGSIDSLGRLVIIDRVKQIFKLAQGECTRLTCLRSFYDVERVTNFGLH
jgi:long-chain acyl-CoA synthetase